MARKKYHEVELPVIDEKVEVLAESEEDLKGRSIKMDLTRKIRGKNFEIAFRINDDGNVNIHRLHIYKYFLRRMMRKSVDYVEDSFVIECEDARIRVKPFLITRKKVSRKTRNGLRKKAKEESEKYMKDKKFKDIISSLLSNEFQKDLSLSLKKVYPLTLCEISDIHIESKKGESEEEKKAKKKIKESSQ